MIRLVNQANMDNLPDDDVPECLWNTMDTSEDVSNAEAERAGLSHDVLENVVESSEQFESTNIALSTRYKNVV